MLENPPGQETYGSLRVVGVVPGLVDLVAALERALQDLGHPLRALDGLHDLVDAEHDLLRGYLLRAAGALALGHVVHSALLVGRAQIRTGQVAILRAVVVQPEVVPLADLGVDVDDVVGGVAGERAAVVHAVVHALDPTQIVRTHTREGLVCVAGAHQRVVVPVRGRRLNGRAAVTADRVVVVQRATRRERVAGFVLGNRLQAAPVGAVQRTSVTLCLGLGSVEAVDGDLRVVDGHLSGLLNNNNNYYILILVLIVFFKRKQTFFANSVRSYKFLDILTRTYIYNATFLNNKKSRSITFLALVVDARRTVDVRRRCCRELPMRSASFRKNTWFGELPDDSECELLGLASRDIFDATNRRRGAPSVFTLAEAHRHANANWR